MSIRIGNKATVTLNAGARLRVFTEPPVNVYTGLRTFYISDTEGDDTRTVTQAQNPATPWKTMRQVEKFGNGTLGTYPNKAAAGDVFKFKCGDTFYCTNRSFGGFRWWGGTYGNSPSGTATYPIMFTSYGTGDRPNFLFPDSVTVLEARDKVVFHFEGIDYIIFDGLQFNDPRPPVSSPENPNTAYKVGGAATGQAIFLGEDDPVNQLMCNNNIVRNCYTNNIGYGISVKGDNNLFTNNVFENFGQMYPLTDASYGQISVELGGSNNVVTYNIMKGGWAWAETFSWNGGAIEFINESNNTVVMYNTIIDCGGVMEFGYGNVSHAGETIKNVLFAYNKVINCDGLAWFNAGITGSNIQIYNNVIVENSLSRYGGINFASGAQDFPTYQPGSCPKYPYPTSTMIGYSAAQNSYTGSTLYDIKNNVFVLSNAPITIVNDYNSNTGLCTATRTYTPSVVSSSLRAAYSNNVYKVSNGSTVGHTLGSGEVSTATQLFTDISNIDPSTWNYYPSASSILIDSGINVGLSADFAGNIVSSPPEIGILEYI